MDWFYNLFVAVFRNHCDKLSNSFGKCDELSNFRKGKQPLSSLKVLYAVNLVSHLNQKAKKSFNVKSVCHIGPCC